MEFQIDKLIFSANFDSGNLRSVEKIDDDFENACSTIEKQSNLKKTVSVYGVERRPLLRARHDHHVRIRTNVDAFESPFENGNRTWFHFSVKNYDPGSIIRISVMNMNRQSKLFAQGHLPVVKLTGPTIDNPVWTTITEEPICDIVNGEFNMTFAHQFSSLSDTITYFAFTFPWSYMDCQKSLDRIECSTAHLLQTHNTKRSRQKSVTEINLNSSAKVESSTIYLHREVLCYSLCGRRVDLLTISDHENQLNEREEKFDPLLFPHSDQIRPWKFANKKVFVITARVHPGETPGSHMFNGILEFLLRESDERSIELRRRYVFKLIPILNPDGVALGHYRTDSRGVNLNRVYLNPNFLLYPSIYAAKALIAYHHLFYGKQMRYPGALSAVKFEKFALLARKCRMILETPQLFPNNQFLRSRPVIDKNIEERETRSPGFPNIAQIALIRRKSSDYKCHQPQWSGRKCQTPGAHLPRLSRASSCGNVRSHPVLSNAKSPCLSAAYELNFQQRRRQSSQPQFVSENDWVSVLKEDTVGDEVNLFTKCLQIGSGCAGDIQTTPTITKSTCPTPHLPGFQRRSSLQNPVAERDLSGAFVHETAIRKIGRSSSAFAQGHSVHIQISSNEMTKTPSIKKSVNAIRFASVPDADTLSDNSYNQQYSASPINHNNCALNVDPPTALSRPYDMQQEYNIKRIHRTPKQNRQTPKKRSSNHKNESDEEKYEANRENLDFEFFDVFQKNLICERNLRAEFLTYCKGDHLADPSLLDVSSEQSNVQCYIDLHGHCTKRGCFCYGNSLKVEKHMIDNVLFARLVATNSAFFDFGACNFSVRNMYARDRITDQTKEGSGRVAVGKHTGLIHCYTVEANYNSGRLVNVLSQAVNDKRCTTPPGCLWGPMKKDVIQNDRGAPNCYLNYQNIMRPVMFMDYGGYVVNTQVKFNLPHFEEMGRGLLLAALDMWGNNPWSRLSNNACGDMYKYKPGTHRTLRALSNIGIGISSQTTAKHPVPASRIRQAEASNLKLLRNWVRRYVVSLAAAEGINLDRWNPSNHEKLSARLISTPVTIQMDEKPYKAAICTPIPQASTDCYGMSMKVTPAVLSPKIQKQILSDFDDPPSDDGDFSAVESAITEHADKQGTPARIKSGFQSESLKHSSKSPTTRHSISQYDQNVNLFQSLRSVNSTRARNTPQEVKAGWRRAHGAFSRLLYINQNSSPVSGRQSIQLGEAATNTSASLRPGGLPHRPEINLVRQNLTPSQKHTRVTHRCFPVQRSNRIAPANSNVVCAQENFRTPRSLAGGYHPAGGVPRQNSKDFRSPAKTTHFIEISRRDNKQIASKKKIILKQNWSETSTSTASNRISSRFSEAKTSSRLPKNKQNDNRSSYLPYTSQKQGQRNIKKANDKSLMRLTTQAIDSRSESPTLALNSAHYKRSAHRVINSSATINPISLPKKFKQLEPRELAKTPTYRSNTSAGDEAKTTRIRRTASIIPTNVAAGVGKILKQAMKEKRLSQLETNSISSRNRKTPRLPRLKAVVMKPNITQKKPPTVFLTVDA